MGWNKHNLSTRWYNIWNGAYTEQGEIPYSVEKGLYLAQANNVYSPAGSLSLRKRPGFSKVRGTTISSTGIVTGMVHLGEIADEFLLSVSIAGTSHNFYRDSANPPGAIAGGTDFTIGQDNLVDWILFKDGTNPVAIAVSRLRDLPQSFVAATTRANFTIAGTGLTSLKPALGEVFGGRALWGDVNRDGTIEDDGVYWSDLRDGNLITDYTLQRFILETKQKDKVRAIRAFGDVAIIGKMHNVFVAVVSEAAAKPYALREFPIGLFEGPISQQGTLAVNKQCFWMSYKGIRSIGLNIDFKDWSQPIRPTIEGLVDTRREFCVGGYDPASGLILFSVSDGSDTVHKTVIALNPENGALYIWTLSRNAFANRFVSDEGRLIGGGYTGFFYNEMTGTAGNLDDATAVIDGDVITPRFWLSKFGYKHKITHVFVEVDPIGSEALTVQFRLDDDTSWSSPTGSPYTISGTDSRLIAVPIKAYARRIQLRFRNNSADEAFSLKAVGIPGDPGNIEVAA